MAVRLSADVIVTIPECWTVFTYAGIRYERYACATGAFPSEWVSVNPK